MLELRKVDPRGPQLEDWLGVLRAADPDGPPHQAAPYLADADDPTKLLELWIGRVDGRPVAAGQADLVGDAWCLVHVDRGCRRRGHGSAMAAHLLRRVAEAGCPRAVSAVVLRPGGPTGRLDFALGQGFRAGDRYSVWLHDLHDGEGVAGDGLQVWVDEPPAVAMEQRVVLQRAFEREAPSSLDVEHDWTPESLTAHLRAGKHGQHVLEALAWEGEVVVGFSTMIVREGAAQAQQKDTFVAPSHRGRGLGAALKETLHVEVRQRYPWVEEVRSFINVTNEPMRRVARQVGFREDAEMVELVQEL